jgi:UDP:flavonoid glycosyltransferase YjiC (YdhE family)
MHKVAYFVHGHGRGHASRALSLVPALRAAGFDVALFASGEAHGVLKQLGGIEPRALVEPGRRMPVRLAQRALVDRATLAELDPALVVSDGEQGAVLAARSLHKPLLAIGHDLVFTSCVLPAGLPRRQLLHQYLNALIPTLLSTRRVAVHFLPCRARDRHTRVARPDAEPSTTASAQRSSRLVCYFRDDNAAHVLVHARAVCGEVSAYGRGSDSAPVDRESFRSLLRRARGAIGSAGSNMISECVLFGTPLLALYREDDAEQALNAQLLERAGAGMACSFERVSRAVVSAFWTRARAGDFCTVPLAEQLPTVVAAVLAAARELVALDR